MTLQEARQKVAENNQYNNWAMLVRYVGQNQIGLTRIESEVEELFRAHWESVGVRKGIEQALEHLEMQQTYDSEGWSSELQAANAGYWIIKSDLWQDLNAAIEQLTVTKQQS